MITNYPNLQTADRIALRINDAVAVSGEKLRSVKIGNRRLVLRESLEDLLRGESPASTG